MAKLDVAQINRNRQTVADSTLETPWNTQIEDSDADFGEVVFNEMPADNVGFMPRVKEK